MRKSDLGERDFTVNGTFRADGSSGMLSAAAVSIPLLGGLAETLTEVPADRKCPGTGRTSPRETTYWPRALCSPRIPTYTFNFVNHVTTNPFFVPTQYGAGRCMCLVRVQVPVDRVLPPRMSPRW